MSCCNSKGDKQHTITTEAKCPNCSSEGLKVSFKTLKSLLKESIADRVIENLTYKYCNSSKCALAYFATDGQLTFLASDLKVKATAKDQSLDTNVCYCFGYTRQDVLDELRMTGHSTTKKMIKKKMRDPGCSCETTNPQGGCCLANVTIWTKKAINMI